MSLGGGGSTPDFNQAAEKQAASSQAAVDTQTAANRANQVNAAGASLNWTKDPTTGQWTQTTQLDPTQQAAQDAQQGTQLARQNMAAGLSGAASDALNRPFKDYSGDEGANAMYSSYARNLDPQWQKSESDLTTKLANMGLDPGSEAYNTMYANFSRAKNDAYQNANTQSTLYGNQYAQGQIANDQASRSEALNLQNLAQGGQDVQNPIFQNYNQAGQGESTQYLSAAQQQEQAQLAQQQMNNQLWGDVISGGSQAASTAMMFSDERLKEDIVRLPIECIPGVPFASWRWKAGGRGFGVIAQDLEKVRPDLVIEEGGYKKVNYGGLL